MTDLNTALREYYTHYYRDQLGLPDWEARVQSRQSEQKSIKKQIDLFQELAGVQSLEGKSVFVVGAGTGGEVEEFLSRGALVKGLEPDNEAINIIKLKLGNQKEEVVQKSTLEEFSTDEKYDYVYCWTVLEHVNDLELSLKNLVSLLRPDGVAFIETPDYRFPMEQHYKVLCPTFLPKFFCKIWLKIMRRPTSFLDSLVFVTPLKIDRIVSELPVISYHIKLPLAQSEKEGKGVRALLARIFNHYFNIRKNQYILLKKMKS